ncbi:LacI family DNA-binding transcriptional regulator [Mesorhizobium sp. CN2-181]|uniref:LacI family DNA-binding transcriptional regulator n=1 Tax=Mesorhizobium yinganensis TaxID=3157707 RepID=UPI0032B6FAB8
MKRALPVTSRDIARFLGVSQSMVSRAFDPAGKVSPANRARIMEAAEKLGYRPNAIARSLSTRRSGIVAIVMGGMENPFYSEVLDKLAAALDLAGFRSLLFRAPPGQDVDGQLPALRQYNVDALIVASASISSRIAEEWRRDSRRIVLFNRTISDADVPSVSCDNFGGARDVANMLADRGHRRVAYVAGPRQTSTNREREAGFLAGLMGAGSSLVGRVDTASYSFAEGFRAAEAAIATKPDAIFFANDILALGGMDYLRGTAGLSIPRDVSVVGFDDIAMAAWPSYLLTTVRQPLDRMVELTIASLERDSATKEMNNIPIEIVLRNTIS